MKHVMIDLETWGTNPGNAIMAIGAVSFDMSGVLDKFMVRVSTPTALALGLTMDGDTVDWWFDPERDAARAEIAKFEPYDIVTALHGLMAWVQQQCPREELGGVWGNGVLMDNNLVLAACRLADVEPTWTYKHDRCYRTIKNLCPDVEFEPVGTYHNPVDDAAGQALHLVKIYAKLGLEL